MCQYRYGRYERKGSQILDKVRNEIEKEGLNWSEIGKELVDKLTGKVMAVTYEFDNLEIDIPKATGPGGQEIGSAKWKISGRFVISTEVQNNSKGSQ